MAMATDPRLEQGAYVSTENRLYYVLRPAGTDRIMLEDCATLEARAVPITEVLAKGTLIRPGGTPLHAQRSRAA